MELQQTFDTLRGILAHHESRLRVLVDKPGDYQVASPTRRDRIGRPLFVAAAQIKKNYVSFHLMPVYVDRELHKSISAGLRKRMQGKACFNFTTVDAEQLKELAALTKKGLACFEKTPVPWG
jgi:hypothetical protein